jgi:hypothetical protein
MLRILLILATLFFLNSCILLSRSDILKKDTSEVVSLLSLEVIYDGEVEKRNSGFAGFCQVSFHDGNFDNVKFRNEKNSSIYFLKNEPGRTILYNMKCLRHIVPILYLKNRKVDLSSWGFWAHQGFINYLGHITITYRSSGFGPKDLFALGGISDDGSGKVDVRIEDNIDDAIVFLNHHYPELKNVPITKSLLIDIADIKPETIPEAYKAGMTSPAVIPQPISAAKQVSKPYSINSYYPPFQQSEPSYHNPYATFPAQ